MGVAAMSEQEVIRYLDGDIQTSNVDSNLPTVNLLNGASIRPTSIDWIWSQWLARSKLTILAGVAGTGKTTVALYFASTVSNAGKFPDSSECKESGNVLIWSSEDDPSDTLVPRLIAAGADLNKIHFVDGVRDCDGEIKSFDPAVDMPALYRSIKTIGGASLLIVDPIVSAVSGDMHKANDVRRSLQAIVDFASEFNCAVIGISHFAKGSKASTPQERVIGSQAFGALARMVWVCAKDEESQTRVFARAKSNISDDTGGFNYSLAQTELPDLNIHTSIVIWGDSIEGSAKDILFDVEGSQEDRPKNATAEAMDALRDILSTEKMIGKEAKSLLMKEGFTEKVIRNAREKLNVEIEKEGFGKDFRTFWKLPFSSLMPKNSSNALQINRAPVEKKGISEEFSI